MSAEPMSYKRRLVILVVSTLAGVVLGLSADFLTDGDAVSLDDVLATLILSPLAVTLGGFAVPLGDRWGLSAAVFSGGLLFWPVYGLCAWQWLRKTTPWLWLLIFLWSAQGFFHAVCRMKMISSA